jgi:hypothetical protein
MKIINKLKEGTELENGDPDGKPDLGITDCKTGSKGDNHGGYFGFRDTSTKKLIDDGEMDVVVHDWQKTSHLLQYFLPLSIWASPTTMDK